MQCTCVSTLCTASCILLTPCVPLQQKQLTCVAWLAPSAHPSLSKTECQTSRHLCHQSTTDAAAGLSRSPCPEAPSRGLCRCLAWRPSKLLRWG